MRACLLFVVVALLALAVVPAFATEFPTELTFTSCSGAPAFSVQQVFGPNVSLSLGESFPLRLRGAFNGSVGHGPYTVMVERDGNHNRAATWSVPADLLASQFGDVASVLSKPEIAVNTTLVDSTLTVTLPSDTPLVHDDDSVLLRFEAQDQASNELVCVVVRVPLAGHDHHDGDSGKANKMLGYACTFVAVVFYGTNFLPVKAYDTGDGVFFQWMMCFGVWLTGLFIQILRKSAFEPFAMLGGVMWCIGNMTAVPIIQLIGLGVGMCLWGSVNLLAGWAAGRFGLLGINKQSVDNQTLNIVGLLICVSSIAIMVQVKSVKEEKESAAANGSLDQALLVGEYPSDGMSVTSVAPPTYPMHTRQSAGLVTDSPLASPALSSGGVVQEAREESWLDRLNPSSRRIVGVSLALVAGCLYGLNFNPPQHLIDSGKGASSHGIDYAFSHFCGIMLTSTVYMVGYTLYKRNKPWVSQQIVVPGLLSGIGWGIAQICMFIANDQIKFVGTFPISSTCPPILASVCAIVFYKEIQGKRNYLFLAAAACITGVGVTLISLSLPKN